MATTLSLVVIFLPLAFMQGRIGRFFSSYGVTVACAIMVSCSCRSPDPDAGVEAPAAYSRRAPAREKSHGGPLMHWIGAHYIAILRWCLGIGGRWWPRWRPVSRQSWSW